jgi:hypothetical protein
MEQHTYLKGKRFLLIAPSFFGYDEAIEAKLEGCGAFVDRLFDRPFDQPSMRAATKIAPEFIGQIAAQIYRRDIAGFDRAIYDYILIINGQTLSPDYLRDLRSQFPSAQIILYLWDSLQNRRSVRRNLPLVDRCLSFDPVDAREYGLEFRPLFFTDSFQKKVSVVPEYEISFVGTVHSDRVAIVDQIDKNLPTGTRRFWYLFMQAPWVYRLRKIYDPAFKGRNKSSFSFVPLPSKELANVFFRSNAILDIEHRQQIGLTIRTFETIGAGRKLVTTNASVGDYDFYDPANIRIINRTKPIVTDANFLQQPYRSIKPEIYDKYSIGGWLREVLNI